MSEASDLAARVAGGDRRALARLLTWIENARDGADEAVALLYARTGRAHTIGVTGAPGAGKSTLTDALISTLRARSASVGVLAVDPSSPSRAGRCSATGSAWAATPATPPSSSARSPTAAISAGSRSPAARGARPRRHGADWTIVETVGVGQAEVEVAGETDTTVVVVTPGWGDHVQASKAGLVEIADVFVVNKADRPGAKQAARDLRLELNLAPDRPWRPPIVLAVASRGEGVDELLAAVDRHREHLESSGELEQRRQARLLAELRSVARELALARLERELAGNGYEELVERVYSRELDPAAAARALVDPAAAPRAA